jgi:hypothetical protein
VPCAPAISRSGTRAPAHGQAIQLPAEPRRGSRCIAPPGDRGHGASAMAFDAGFCRNMLPRSREASTSFHAP